MFSIEFMYMIMLNCVTSITYVYVLSTSVFYEQLNIANDKYNNARMGGKYHFFSWNKSMMPRGLLLKLSFLRTSPGNCFLRRLVLNRHVRPRISQIPMLLRRVLLTISLLLLVMRWRVLPLLWRRLLLLLVVILQLMLRNFVSSSGNVGKQA